MSTNKPLIYGDKNINLLRSELGYLVPKDVPSKVAIFIELMGKQILYCENGFSSQQQSHFIFVMNKNKVAHLINQCLNCHKLIFNFNRQMTFGLKY